MTTETVQRLCLQLFSLFVATYAVFSILLLQTCNVGQFYVLPVVLTVASAVAFRYAATFHRYSKPMYRILALAMTGIAVSVSGFFAIDTVLSTGPLRELAHDVRLEVVAAETTGFLPVDWIALLFGFAWILTLIGSLWPTDSSPYPKPAAVDELAASPVYVGLACTIFGLWAVLLVGFAIQRLLIIAPLFEELLKFGVALLVGSTLFGRSLLGRIGVAIVVGSLFGIIEHATTYPMETQTLYLFRTLFHTSTTVLSVTVYTVFERRGEESLRWLAPSYSVAIHFFNNTFAVLSTVVATILGQSWSTTPSIVYGFAAVLVTNLVLLTALLSEDTLVSIHTPFANVLSDLV